MPFSEKVRQTVLVKSHRRCCVCHKFAGRNVNVHHIIQEADGGPNTLENAICLCLVCHAEAGHFNSRHPLGTKYSPKELKAHRDQWWQQCESQTAADVKHPPEEVGRLRKFLNQYSILFRYLFQQGSELAFRIDIQSLDAIRILTINWETDTCRSFDLEIRRLQDEIVKSSAAIQDIIDEDENVYSCNDSRHLTFDGSITPNEVLQKKRKQIAALVHQIAACHTVLSDIATENADPG